MDNNNNKPDNNRNDKNRRNMNGLLHLVAWALVLTIGLQYLHIYMGKNNPKADQQFEISFTEFMELVKEDHVEEVVFKDGLITITLPRAMSTPWRTPRGRPRSTRRTSPSTPWP